MATEPPKIFSARRRLALRRRMLRLQGRDDAPCYLAQEMAEDVVERLEFLRHETRRALVIGANGELLRDRFPDDVQELELAGADFDEEQPFPMAGYDLVASLGTLDTVNDLPGALIHLRSALAPGGLMIASFLGAGSLPRLRSALLEADGDMPAARMHPMVDIRAGGQLLQRTGWKNPVIDSISLKVRFGSLDRLIADLRAQGLTNVLHSAPPVLTRRKLAAARKAFLAQSDEDGRVTETFEVLTLSGWRPPALGE